MSFRATDIAIKRRRYRASLPLLVFGLTAIMGLVCAVVPALGDYLLIVGGFLLAEGVLFCFAPLLLPDGAWSGEERVALSGDEKGVSVGGKRVLSRARIASANLERQLNGSVRVSLIGHSPRHSFEAIFDDVDRAKAFLSSLMLEAEQSTSYFRVLRGPLEGKASRALAQAITVAGGLLLLGGVVLAMARLHSDALLLVYLPLLLIYSFARKRLRGRALVVIGADRVVLRVGRALRSIPYSSIREVVTHDDRVQVVLRSGEAIALRFPSTGQESDLEPAAMTHRLEEGIRASARSEGDGALDTVLSRAGRPIAEWICALREIGSPVHGNYRVAPVPEDALWRLVEQPSAAPSARAGAAVALAASLDDRGRTRIRAAANATALPGVRALFCAVADPEGEEGIARALEACGEAHDAER